MGGFRRRLVAAVTLTVATTGWLGPGVTSAVGSTSTRSVSVAPTLAVGSPAWVSVSVATLWRARSAARDVDRPALASPARITRWLARMTLDQRRALNGRADTQALLGTRVVVLRLRPHWAKVAVPSQPTPLDSRGYPGWVPRRQLTAAAPTPATQRATVVSQLTWLRQDSAAGARVLRVSFGTELPVVGRAGRWVRVATPTGEILRVLTTTVSVHSPGDPALPATRADLVASARMFTGLDYLWAGRSGFGFDCSGFTSLVYQVHGRRIPRDAAPQSQAGRTRPGLRKGDLMFYATSGRVHHVSMYVGRGRMVHSPRTGTPVQVISTDTTAYAQEYAGARRYLR